MDENPLHKRFIIGAITVFIFSIVIAYNCAQSNHEEGEAKSRAIANCYRTGKDLASCRILYRDYLDYREKEY